MKGQKQPCLEDWRRVCLQATVYLSLFADPDSCSQHNCRGQVQNGRSGRQVQLLRLHQGSHRPPLKPLTGAESLLLWARACQSLYQVLSFFWCRRVGLTTSGLESAVCPFLISIMAGCCPRVGDATLSKQVHLSVPQCRTAGKTLSFQPQTISSSESTGDGFVTFPSSCPTAVTLPLSSTTNKEEVSA